MGHLSTKDRIYTPWKSLLCNTHTNIQDFFFWLILEICVFFWYWIYSINNLTISYLLFKFYGAWSQFVQYVQCLLSSKVLIYLNTWLMLLLYNVFEDSFQKLKEWLHSCADKLTETMVYRLWFDFFSSAVWSKSDSSIGNGWGNKV